MWLHCSPKKPPAILRPTSLINTSQAELISYNLLWRFHPSLHQTVTRVSVYFWAESKLLNVIMLQFLISILISWTSEVLHYHFLQTSVALENTGCSALTGTNSDDWLNSSWKQHFSCKPIGEPSLYMHSWSCWWMFSKDMLVYNSAVFAVAQTNVFLLFGLLFPLPVTLFAFFIFKKKTCYLSFQLVVLVVFWRGFTCCLSEANLSFDRCLLKITSVEQMWDVGVLLWSVLRSCNNCIWIKLIRQTRKV